MLDSWGTSGTWLRPWRPKWSLGELSSPTPPAHVCSSFHKIQHVLMCRGFLLILPAPPAPRWLCCSWSHEGLPCRSKTPIASSPSSISSAPCSATRWSLCMTVNSLDMKLKVQTLLFKTSFPGGNCKLYHPLLISFCVLFYFKEIYIVSFGSCTPSCC